MIGHCEVQSEDWLRSTWESGGWFCFPLEDAQSVSAAFMCRSAYKRQRRDRSSNKEEMNTNFWNEQIISLQRCTSSECLTWYIAAGTVMNILIRCSICVGEVIGKLLERAGSLPKASSKSCYTAAGVTRWDTEAEIKAGSPPLHSLKKSLLVL